MRKRRFPGVLAAFGFGIAAMALPLTAAQAESVCDILIDYNDAFVDIEGEVQAVTMPHAEGGTAPVPMTPYTLVLTGGGAHLLVGQDVVRRGYWDYCSEDCANGPIAVEWEDEYGLDQGDDPNQATLFCRMAIDRMKATAGY